MKIDPLTHSLRERYLAILGLDVRRADERSLARLIEHHHERVPFENLTKLIARQRAEIEGATALMPIPGRFVDSASRLGSGDTCFGIAVSFRALLSAVGFDAFLMSADVPPLTKNHLVVGVRLGAATYLCDAGFGAPTRWPIPLEPQGPERSYDAGYCKVRLVSSPGGFEIHLAWGTSPEQLAYRVRPVPVSDEDAIRAAAHSFQDPEAEFLKRLIVKRCARGACMSAVDKTLEVRTAAGVMKQPMETAETFADLVQAQMGIERDHALRAVRALKARGIDPYAGGPLVPW